MRRSEKFSMLWLMSPHTCSQRHLVVQAISIVSAGDITRKPLPAGSPPFREGLVDCRRDGHFSDLSLSMPQLRIPRGKEDCGPHCDVLCLATWYFSVTFE